MKPFNVMAALLCILFIVSTCTALEANVPVVADKKLTIDLGPDFVVSDRQIESSDPGSVISNFTIINKKDPEIKSALIGVIAYSGDIAKLIDPAGVSNLTFSEMINSAKLNGANETGNWSTSNSVGQLVEVQNMKLPLFEPDMSFAAWPLGRSTIVIFGSLFDKEINEKIIGTLKIV
ncbi:MAG: hypothetical protein MUO26_09860 [Methanotrichaceae archaeon]|nr:hypothetical protein [Methanotrichaceae archaeon]